MYNLQTILAAARKYNPCDDFLCDAYGISSGEDLDAMVLAPAWTPEKILSGCEVRTKCLKHISTTSAYIVEFSGVRIGWIQFGIGACSLMDAALPLADSRVRRLIFLGSAGALKADISLGTLVTPKECYSYDSSSIYLREGLEASNFGRTVVPHCPEFIGRVIRAAEAAGIQVAQRRTFCTDSVICEYAKLDEILSTGAEVIEMETAAFYECARLLGRDAVALLCISDNSAAGIGLVGRSEEDTRRYHESRGSHLPRLIEMICRLEQ